MRIRPAIDRRIDPIPCRGARRLLVIAMVTSLTIAVGIAADLRLRASHPEKNAKIWMQTLCLTAPAFQPAGSPGRHPETVHPAVDLRFAAGLETVP